MTDHKIGLLGKITAIDCMTLMDLSDSYTGSLIDLYDDKQNQENLTIEKRERGFKKTTESQSTSRSKITSQQDVQKFVIFAEAHNEMQEVAVKNKRPPLSQTRQGIANYWQDMFFRHNTWQESEVEKKTISLENSVTQWQIYHKAKVKIYQDLVDLSRLEYLNSSDFKISKIDYFSSKEIAILFNTDEKIRFIKASYYKDDKFYMSKLNDSLTISDDHDETQEQAITTTFTKLEDELKDLYQNWHLKSEQDLADIGLKIATTYQEAIGVPPEERIKECVFENLSTFFR